jgi:hypothetical protein
MCRNIYPLFSGQCVETRTLVSFDNGEIFSHELEQLEESEVINLLNFWSILLTFICAYFLYDPLTSTAGWFLIILVLIIRFLA